MIICNHRLSPPFSLCEHVLLFAMASQHTVFLYYLSHNLYMCLLVTVTVLTPNLPREDDYVGLGDGAWAFRCTGGILPVRGPFRVWLQAVPIQTLSGLGDLSIDTTVDACNKPTRTWCVVNCFQPLLRT